jgi:hypothetical protein
LREYLLHQGLSDRQFIEQLGVYGLPDITTKLASYRAVLCDIKKRGNFPLNKPTSHGGRMLAAWSSLLGKRRVESLYPDTAVEPSTVSTPTHVVTVSPSLPIEQAPEETGRKRSKGDLLEEELSACATSFQHRSIIFVQTYIYFFSSYDPVTDAHRRRVMTTQAAASFRRHLRQIHGF